MKEAGIHAILQKINADAEQHSSECLAQRKNDIDHEADSKIALYAEELSKRREMLKNHIEHEYALMLDRLNSRFDRELLAYRHKLIADIFDMATVKLRAASTQEFYDMFAAAVHGLTGDFTLYIGELSEGKLNAQRVKEIENENQGLTITLSPDPVPGKSGFLLRDDRVEYNCLFEDLIEDKKSEQTNMILKEVFGELLN